MPPATLIDVSSTKLSASPISIASHTQTTSHIPVVDTPSPPTTGFTGSQPPLLPRNPRSTSSRLIRSNSFSSQLAPYLVQSPGPPIRIPPASQPTHRHLASDQNIKSDSPLRTRANQYPRSQ